MCLLIGIHYCNLKGGSLFAFFSSNRRIGILPDPQPLDIKICVVFANIFLKAVSAVVHYRYMPIDRKSLKYFQSLAAVLLYRYRIPGTYYSSIIILALDLKYDPASDPDWHQIESRIRPGWNQTLGQTPNAAAT